MNAINRWDLGNLFSILATNLSLMEADKSGLAGFSYTECRELHNRLYPVMLDVISGKVTSINIIEN